jgi:hypothetical protein
MLLLLEKLQLSIIHNHMQRVFNKMLGHIIETAGMCLGTQRFTSTTEILHTTIFSKCDADIILYSALVHPKETEWCLQCKYT